MDKSVRSYLNDYRIILWCILIIAITLIAVGSLFTIITAFFYQPSTLELSELEISYKKLLTISFKTPIPYLFILLSGVFLLVVIWLKKINIPTDNGVYNLKNGTFKRLNQDQVNNLSQIDFGNAEEF